MQKMALSADVRGASCVCVDVPTLQIHAICANSKDVSNVANAADLPYRSLEVKPMLGRSVPEPRTLYLSMTRSFK